MLYLLQVLKIPEEKQFRPLHPLALVDVAMREREEEKKNLFTDFGPNSRALTQEADIKIRSVNWQSKRHLCNCS